MDATQISILIGVTAAQAISMALPYWVGRQSGQRAGYVAAGEQMSAEIDEARQGVDKTQREIRALSCDLAQLRAQKALEVRRHLEEIAALKLELTESRAHALQHVALLREAAKTIRLACSGWEAMGATLKARECRPQAADLDRIADWMQRDFTASKEALHA